MERREEGRGWREERRAHELGGRLGREERGRLIVE
jgi:hypothetical protein